MAQAALLLLLGLSGIVVAFDSSEIRMLGSDYVNSKRSVSEFGRMERSLDDVSSPLIRFGKRSPDGAPLIRFGRAPEASPLIRFGKRAAPDGAPLIRFGRAPEASPIIRFGKRSDGAPLIRFGRSAGAPLIRFGRSFSDDEEMFRQARAPDAASPLIRFGRKRSVAVVG